MKDKTIIEFNNLIAFHPGSYIKDIIDDLELTQKEYAEKLDITEKVLSDLVNGKVRLSRDVAYKLSKATGISIKSWLNLQNSYDKKILEIKNAKKRDKNKQIANMIDSKYLKDMKVIENKKRVSIDEKIDQICKSFSISSLDYLRKLPVNVSYRNVSKKFDEKTIVNSNVMVEIAKNIARGVEAPKYNNKKLKKLVPKIPRWTLLDPEVALHTATDELNECGVILVILPNLKNSTINGFVKKLRNGSVLLMLNDRGKDSDIFWFSLLHEISHILNNEYEVFLPGNSVDYAIENQADNFARNILINKEKYNDFIKSKKITKSNVKDFAEQNKIHPGIVVGRLQNDGIIGYHELYELKSTINIKKHGKFTYTEKYLN